MTFISLYSIPSYQIFFECFVHFLWLLDFLDVGVDLLGQRAEGWHAGVVFLVYEHYLREEWNKVLLAYKILTTRHWNSEILELNTIIFKKIKRFLVFQTLINFQRSVDETFNLRFWKRYLSPKICKASKCHTQTHKRLKERNRRYELKAVLAEGGGGATSTKANKQTLLFSSFSWNFTKGTTS